MLRALALTCLLAAPVMADQGKAIFHVDPPRALVFYEVSTVSSNDQRKLLGPQGQELTLELPADRGDIRLFFVDPQGNFEEEERKINKFLLATPALYHFPGKHERLYLKPANLGGYLYRYRNALSGTAFVLSLIHI